MPHTGAWTLSSPRGEDAGPRLRNAVLGWGHAVRARAQGFRIHVGRGSAQLTREVEPGDARTKLPRGVWGTGGDGPRKQQNGGQGAGGHQGPNLRPEDHKAEVKKRQPGPSERDTGPTGPALGGDGCPEDSSAETRQEPEGNRQRCSTKRKGPRDRECHRDGHGDAVPGMRPEGGERAGAVGRKASSAKTWTGKQAGRGRGTHGGGRA